MIFTASDASLAQSLKHWEWAEYVSCAVVASGCTGEYIANFTRLWTGGIEERKVRLEKRSTLLLIFALALELVCLVKTNSISGLLIGSISEKASAADAKSRSAIENSFLAEKKANEAGTSADEAKQKAEGVGKQADALAIGMEAASGKLTELNQDILAEGPRRRLLQNGEDVFVKALKPFAGQQITIVRCGNEDREQFDFETALAQVWPKVGWVSGGAQWDQCPLIGWNEIYFVSNAGNFAERWAGMPAVQMMRPACGDKGKTVSDALCNVLNDLRIFTVAFEERATPDAIIRAKLLSSADGSPAEMALKDPNRIFLLIGHASPMFTNRQKQPTKNAKTK